MEIEMTTPVATAFETRPCAVCQNTYQMNFILPSDVMDNPPNPTSSDVEVVDQPAFNVYVRYVRDVLVISFKKTVLRQLFKVVKLL